MVQYLWDKIGCPFLDLIGSRSDKQISLEPCDNVEKLVSKYTSLFDGGLGTIKGVMAHLKLKGNATPQFFKPKLVPFPLKEKITEELERLERIGRCIGDLVELSDWATPIAPGRTRWHCEDLW